jgi:hypothetical protein
MAVPVESDGHKTEDSTTASRGIRSHHEIKSTSDEDSHRSHSGDDKRYHGGDNGKDKTRASPSAFQKYSSGLLSRALPDVQWISQNNTWSKWKPVIRCAIAAWICGLFFVIPGIENAMGQAIFVSLISNKT